MIWGLHSGGWMSGLYHKAPDQYRAQIELLAEFGLKSTTWSAKDLMAMDPGKRHELARLAAEASVNINLGLGIDYFAAEGDYARSLDATLQAIQTLASQFRSRTCITGINRNYHHYSRDLPVAKQIDVLSPRMAPLAKLCAEADCPLCVHTVTHFGGDMAELCRRTPKLALCFDTANCFLIGEVPLDAAHVVAPYTRSTHFKDHFVEPSFNPLGLRARGAIPGEGDCDLRQIYAILKEKAPDPQNLVMELEIDPVVDDKQQPLNQRDVLRKAVDFIKTLK